MTESENEAIASALQDIAQKNLLVPKHGSKKNWNTKSARRFKRN